MVWKQFHNFLKKANANYAVGLLFIHQFMKNINKSIRITPY